MLDKKGFDLWAGGYDKAVGLSDEEQSYPFAGYKDVLAGIYRLVMAEMGFEKLSHCAGLLTLGAGTPAFKKRS